MLASDTINAMFAVMSHGLRYPRTAAADDTMGGATFKLAGAVAPTKKLKNSAKS
jgi:hypothetical protein